MLSSNLFVVGYPKSGNTWTCKLLGNILSMPIREDNKTHSEFNLRNNLVALSFNPMVIKSHLVPKDFLAEESPSPKYVIYISRDVRDVAISSFFYWMRFLEYNNGIEYRLVNKKMFSGYFTNRKMRHYLLDFASKSSKDFRFSDWSTHHKLWLNDEWGSDVKLIQIRYEDLLIDTKGQLERIITQLDIDVNYLGKTIDQVVSEESFKSLKRNYNATGDKLNSNFLRKGQSGDWKNYFDDELSYFFEERYGDCMNELNYFIS